MGEEVTHPQPPSQLIPLDNRPLPFDCYNVFAYEETETLFIKRMLQPSDGLKVRLPSLEPITGEIFVGFSFSNAGIFPWETMGTEFTGFGQKQKQFSTSARFSAGSQAWAENLTRYISSA